MKIGTRFCEVSALTGAPAMVICVTPSAQDLKANAGHKAQLGVREVEVELQTRDVFDNLHPDLKALVCLLAYLPFSHREIELDFAVSAHFAQAVETYTRRKITPVDANIIPRETPLDGLDAMAFSGGADSCAALFLMPKNTVPVFLQRLQTPGCAAGLYRDDAALVSCEAVKAAGYNVRVIRSNIEFGRAPVGFAVDWSNMAPIILHAGAYGFRSVSCGMVLESAFALGSNRYSDLQERTVYAGWAPLFEAVGVPLSLPTAGLSEVMTSIIAKNFVPHWQPCSCVRGQANVTCGTCFKCFRKKLIDAAIARESIAPVHFDSLKIPKAKDVRVHLSHAPIHHESVLAYSLHFMQPCEHEAYLALYEKTVPIMRYGKGLFWMGRHYTPALKYVPEFLRRSVSERILAVCDAMSARDESIVEGWDLTGVVTSQIYLNAQNSLLQVLGMEEHLDAA